MKKSDNSDMTPYKNLEFKQFLKTIKNGQAAHWIDLALAIGVDQDTITAWKKTPKAQQAIQDGIDHAVEQMITVGAKDWRMWEAKLKMLGVNPANKLDLTSGGERLEPVIVKVIHEPTRDTDTAGV
jgi:hypothetical protein